MNAKMQSNERFLRRRHARRLPFIVRAVTICSLATMSMAAPAQTIVTDHIINTAESAQTQVPVTFGQVFKAGDVPHGSTVTATLGGQPIPIQVNVKATNPDGSVRHAVLTVMVPSLSAGADLPLTLTSEPRANAAAARNAITPAQLLATDYDAKASLNIGGTTYAADARKLLQAATSKHVCKAWNRYCNVWLSGELTSAWVVSGPVTSAGGSAAKHLRVYFAVRAYAGLTPGTIGDVRTDIVVENSNAFAPQGQPQYTATLTSGSASYTSPALTQYAYTRWHHVLWWNNAEAQVYLRQDTRYIQASKAVSRYMSIKPTRQFLAGLRQTCPPLNHCDQTKGMANTGSQAAIGPLPRWTSVYILDPDPHAYHWMLANTDALGAYSIHYRDSETGWPASIEKHPYATIIGWAGANAAAKGAGGIAAKYKRDLLPSCVNNNVVTRCGHPWYVTGNPNMWDSAHQPAESYVPYMVTGDYYYMAELGFGASHNDLWSGAQYRGYAKGLIGPSHGQVRGKAWVLREMADAAWLLPDTYPLKKEFNRIVENSLAFWNKTYTDNPGANRLGLMNSGTRPYSMHGGNHNAVAPWQHNFLIWSANHAAELGFPGAAQFRNWLAKFEIGLMTDWLHNPAHGYCWLKASAYTIQVRDASGHWLQSFTSVYAANYPNLVGLACNSAAMVDAIAKREKRHWQTGEMSGYPESASGYPAHFQIGVAAAAASGLPGAAKAWQIFQSRTVKPKPPHAYNNYPNFAIAPRGRSH